MERSMYRYALDILTEDGRLLGQAPIEPDWGPALEWASFQGIRQERLPGRMGSHPGVIEPVWDPARGEPHVSGFRAVIPGENGKAASSHFTTSYFRPLAHEASATFVEKGLLKGGDLFRFRVCAFVVPSAHPAPGSTNGLEVDEIVRPLPLGNKPLRSFIEAKANEAKASTNIETERSANIETEGSTNIETERSATKETEVSVSVDKKAGASVDAAAPLKEEARTSAYKAGGPVGAGSGGAARDVPVVIPRHVLDETVSLCWEAQDVEIGGVLLGKLHRDPEIGEIFLEVTAQIPAQHTLSRAARLTFTAQTWAAVDVAIKLRRRDEIKLGWWHYHPDWCRGCPPEKRRNCNGSSAFFSAQDVSLHRVCFSSAYHIALLICNSSTSKLGCYLFGWREGEVVARGFNIIGEASAQSERRARREEKAGREKRACREERARSNEEPAV